MTNCLLGEKSATDGNPFRYVVVMRNRIFRNGRYQNQISITNKSLEENGGGSFTNSSKI